MVNLVLAAAAFLAIHLVVAGTAIRSAIVRVIGEKGFRAAFSVASIAGIWWLSAAYDPALASEDNRQLWVAPLWLRHLGPIVVLLATLLVVLGMSQPNPTAVGGDARLATNHVARGILRVTRHPFLWGVALWGFFHVAANGDTASVVLFGALALLSLLGTVSIDAKLRRRHGPAYEAYVAETSNVPFAAIVAGRQRLSLAEIGWWRPALAVAIFAVLLMGHEWAFGVNPLAA